ncbi:hypothetical protein M9Y10_018499 [Tritrichomonas musculus]|uniref:DUF3447 domain-containing protein n=1 Tax=Tritrichomonas musculus TaxID=1915356 RepID=A0ABR2HMK8_9EUKA
MKTQTQIENLKSLQFSVLDFIDNEDGNEEHFENLCHLIERLKITKNKPEFKLFLSLIISISNNHHRNVNFFEKIERILMEYKKIIGEYFSNNEIFTMFASNKRLILFLINEKVIYFYKYILNEIEKNGYEEYFLLEINNYYQNNDKIITCDFNEKRKAGENDNKLCEIIRKDLIEDFITLVNQNQYPIDSNIEKSIYETNSFLLLKKEIKLIEYAAFYGSCKIFKYLFRCGETLSPSIWLYAVHSNNLKMINLLEEYLINPNQEKIDDEEIFPILKIIIESIACHNNDITNYFLNKEANFVKNKEKLIQAKSARYYNFAYFPERINNIKFFLYLCKYDYQTLVETFISKKKVSIEKMKIIKHKIFLMTLYAIFQIKFCFVI